MASTQLTLHMVWLLFAYSFPGTILGQDDPNAQQLQALRPRGRIRIADMQSPPVPPLLDHGPMRWPDFGPIVAPGPGAMPMPASSTVHTHIPLLRDQPEGNNGDIVPPSEGHVKEGVVYGNWKPEHPLKPENEEFQPKQRKYGRLEAMLMGLPVDEAAVERRETSSEDLSSESGSHDAPVGYQNPYERRDSFDHTQESRGRWRRPSPSMPMQSPSQPQIEVVRLNSSDPMLRAVAKEINESIETTTARRQQVQTTEDNWMPLPNPYPTHSYEGTQPVPRVVAKASSTPTPTLSSSRATESTTVALSWPTDFLEATASTTPRTFQDANSGGSSSSIDRVDHMDSIDRIDDDIDDYKYYEEGLNSAQMHSELSIPENLLPQLPLNITRVGIPYEERNSAEEPTICVPLTVSEVATDSATPVVVEVERVYCFPLPKVEIKTGNIRQLYPHPTDSEKAASEGSSPGPIDQAETVLTAGAQRRNSYMLLLVIWTCLFSRL